MKARSSQENWKKGDEINVLSKFWEGMKWIPVVSRDCDRRVGGFCEHIAIDGSSQGASGRDAACGWAVVQLDNDKEEEPWYAIYGTMLQRTIKRTELSELTVALASLV